MYGCRRAVRVGAPRRVLPSRHVTTWSTRSATAHAEPWRDACGTAVVLRSDRRRTTAVPGEDARAAPAAPRRAPHISERRVPSWLLGGRLLTVSPYDPLRQLACCRGLPPSVVPEHAQQRSWQPSPDGGSPRGSSRSTEPDRAR